MLPKLKSLLYIGNKLAEHGINLTSIETLGPILEKEGYRVRYASSFNNKVLRMLDMCWKTLRYAHQSDYVLIDTYSTQNFWYAFVISQLCRLLGLKYIPKLHGGDLPNRLKKNPYLCKLIFANSYLNVAPSGYLMDAYQKAGFTNLVYIPNTIEISNYPYKKRSLLRPRLFWVRAFSQIYNPEMAIHVANELKKKFPDTILCMVGPDRNGNIARMKQLAIEMGVDATFTGKLSKQEWTSLSEQYDIFINTTHFDNTPVSVIEAIALGLPVVSTNVGGIPFLLEDGRTALLVNDNDVPAMVNAITNLLEDQEQVSALVQNALELVGEFDSSKVKCMWFEILE